MCLVFILLFQQAILFFDFLSFSIDSQDIYFQNHLKILLNKPIKRAKNSVHSLSCANFFYYDE